MTPEEWRNPAYHMIERDKRIAQLQALCARAADALVGLSVIAGADWHNGLIAELRKAAQ